MKFDIYAKIIKLGEIKDIQISFFLVLKLRLLSTFKTYCFWGSLPIYQSNPLVEIKLIDF